MDERERERMGEVPRSDLPSRDPSLPMHRPRVDGRAAEPQIGGAVLGMSALWRGVEFREHETDPSKVAVAEGVVAGWHRPTLRGPRRAASNPATCVQALKQRSGREFCASLDEALPSRRSAGPDLGSP